MKAKLFISLSVIALMGVSSVSYGELIRYASGDGKVPKGDCLEMVCAHGCVEDSNGNYVGHCCGDGSLNSECYGEHCCSGGLVCSNPIGKGKCSACVSDENACKKCVGNMWVMVAPNTPIDGNVCHLCDGSGGMKNAAANTPANESGCLKCDGLGGIFSVADGTQVGNNPCQVCDGQGNTKSLDDGQNASGSCCAGGVEVACPSSEQCIEGTILCGDECCEIGFCVNGSCEDSSSDCLPEDVCGSDCCDEGEVCVNGSCVSDESSSQCEEDMTPCGDDCCRADQTCVNGVCQSLSSDCPPEDLCGDTCCPDGTCVNGVCTQTQCTLSVGTVLLERAKAGSATVNLPCAGKYEIIAIGAGGGYGGDRNGSGSHNRATAGSGGSGASFKGTINITKAQNVSVKIGKGGSTVLEAKGGSQGGTGGTTSVGSFVSCPGGTGGYAKTDSHSNSNGKDYYAGSGARSCTVGSKVTAEINAGGQDGGVAYTKSTKAKTDISGSSSELGGTSKGGCDSGVWSFKHDRRDIPSAGNCGYVKITYKG